MTTAKQTAIPSIRAPGYVAILEDGEPVISFWAWQPAAVYKNKETGETQISFPQMWLGTTASVEEVVTAMGAAMALYGKAKMKKAA